MIPASGPGSRRPKGMSIEDWIDANSHYELGPLATQCKVWDRARRNDYGVVMIARKLWLVHRWAWIQHHGEPPRDKPLVLHRCDNPPCFELDHLFVGTDADNHADKMSKGRQSHAYGARYGESNPAAKLTDDQVSEVRRKYATGQVLQRELAVEFQTTQGVISMIVNNKTRKITH